MNETSPADTSETKTAAPAQMQPPPAANGKRKRVGIVILVLIVACVFSGSRWWLHSQVNISTDNAFVEAHLHTIAARVAGRVDNVAVRDNQFVRKGELLFQIEPADYRVKVAAAAAALNITRNETSVDYARVELSRAELQQSRAKLEQAESDLKRGRALFAKEVVSREHLERLETAAKVAAAMVAEKEENLKRFQAEAGISTAGSKEAKAAQRQAQLDEAGLHLGYTRVTAPADGYVTRKSIEPGNFVQIGQPAMVVVALDDAWITANYKESQLTHIKPGQKVEFLIDAYPGKKFTGRVESIMAGTGAAFSLLPPENATGNYVKVVQRIPLRIAIDRSSDPEQLLRAGMSVVPTVITGRTVKDILTDLVHFK
jgi:membrane fusion protein, multidrug efflux system